MVEQDFNQLKNWLDCDRLRVGAVSVQGKLLVSTIGTALRMMMLNSAKQMEDRKAKLVIPGNSMDRLLAELTLVRLINETTPTLGSGTVFLRNSRITDPELV